MNNANRWHCQQARRKLRFRKALDYYQQLDQTAIRGTHGQAIAEPELRRIAGQPLSDIQWSAIAPLVSSAIEQIPMGQRGVYLVRYRDNPAEINPVSIIYVSSAAYCLRSRLIADHEGRGNPFLPDLVQANPRDICFQYAECDDPKNAEVYLIRAFSYPICN